MLMGMFGWFFGGIEALFLFLVMILILYWVYNDARTRYPRESAMPLVWLVIVFFTGFLGLIIYLIVRPRERVREEEEEERYEGYKRYEPIEPE